MRNKEDRKSHREYVKGMEKEWREEKRRRIEEEKKPKMGWSKPEGPEWASPIEGEEGEKAKKGQMRADDFRRNLGSDEKRKDVMKDMVGEEEDMSEDENGKQGKRRKLGQLEITELECLVGKWVEEVECQVIEEEDWEEEEWGQTDYVPFRSENEANQLYMEWRFNIMDQGLTQTIEDPPPSKIIESHARGGSPSTFRYHDPPPNLNPQGNSD